MLAVAAFRLLRVPFFLVPVVLPARRTWIGERAGLHGRRWAGLRFHRLVSRGDIEHILPGLMHDGIEEAIRIH